MSNKFDINPYEDIFNINSDKIMQVLKSNTYNYENAKIMTLDNIDL